MASKRSEPEALEAKEARFQQADRYLALFEEAFDELHTAVIQRIKDPLIYLRPHADYPRVTALASGFPTFHEAGYFDERCPRDYVGSIRPRGILAAISPTLPKIDLPKTAALASFLRGHDIGKRFDLFFKDNTPYDGQVEGLICSAVERYLHLFGKNTPLDIKKRERVILPLFFATAFKDLRLRLVVPITLTHFETRHFRLSATASIIRLPQKLQLARARISTIGSGATAGVVGAATHAFVSNGWSLDVESITDVHRSLSRISADASDTIDSFFGALRVATGVKTGYAQVVWVPQGWALSYFCDLPPVYGVAVRQYHSEDDNYGWTKNGATVNAAQLNEVRRIYSGIIENKSEALRLALRRLNNCLTRADVADAILDGTIGLELLLGDEENQSLSYKLRLRIAALASLHGDPSRSAMEFLGMAKRLYNARSSIVHGLRKRGSKKASGSSEMKHIDERALASDLLRFVLNALLSHPEYRDNPTRIDEELLLRGAKISDRDQERISTK